MLRSTNLGASALFVALLGSTAAQADITPEEVWANWQSMMEGMGQTVAVGSSARDGDTLVVSGIALSNEIEGGTFSVTIDEARLRDRGDGTVEITLSDSIPYELQMAPEGAEAVQMAATLNQSGAAILVSGSAEDTTYDYSASALELAMKTESGAEGTAPIDTTFGLTAPKGSYHVVTAAGRSGTSTFSADAMNYGFSGTNPEDQSTFATTGTLNGLTGTGEFTFPDGIDMSNMGAALQAGLRMAGAYAFESGAGNSTFGGPEAGSLDFTGGAGTLNFAMSSAGIAYGGTSAEMSLAFTGAAMPLPVNASMQESTFNFTMPVEKRDEAQPFGLVMKMIGLELSDELWSMVDPTAQLPRDPATLIVDVSGEGKLGIDIFDAAQLEAMGEAAPGELNSVSLNELKVSAVGAELTGSGAATFDNSMGVPMPLGAIDLRLVGANALMGKLTAMGLLPEDQVMGMQMMLGLFAVPDGEDAVKSRIEFKEGGSIFANGQQIK